MIKWDKNIDAQIKRNVERTETAFEDASWQKMNVKLLKHTAEKKRKKKYTYYLLGALGFMAIGFMVGQITLSDETHNTENKESTSTLTSTPKNSSEKVEYNNLPYSNDQKYDSWPQYPNKVPKGVNRKNLTNEYTSIDTEKSTLNANIKDNKTENQESGQAAKRSERNTKLASNNASSSSPFQDKTNLTDYNNTSTNTSISRSNFGFPNTDDMFGKTVTGPTNGLAAGNFIQKSGLDLSTGFALKNDTESNNEREEKNGVDSNRSYHNNRPEAAANDYLHENNGISNEAIKHATNHETVTDNTSVTSAGSDGTKNEENVAKSGYSDNDTQPGVAANDHLHENNGISNEAAKLPADVENATINTSDAFAAPQMKSATKNSNVYNSIENYLSGVDQLNENNPLNKEAVIAPATDAHASHNPSAAQKINPKVKFTHLDTSEISCLAFNSLWSAQFAFANYSNPTEVHANQINIRSEQSADEEKEKIDKAAKKLLKKEQRIADKKSREQQKEINDRFNDGFSLRPDFIGLSGGLIKVGNQAFTNWKFNENWNVSLFAEYPLSTRLNLNVHLLYSRIDYQHDFYEVKTISPTINSIKESNTIYLNEWGSDFNFTYTISGKLKLGAGIHIGRINSKIAQKQYYDSDINNYETSKAIKLTNVASNFVVSYPIIDRLAIGLYQYFDLKNLLSGGENRTANPVRLNRTGITLSYKISCMKKNKNL